ncbi:hypothetical protein BDA99DRAFT_534902 [Phascolomyces articulosus]|uniref:Uncharacterized protein n=1 Tax=Phascolomyces articulosus TaxID=60185 RepID=A0AAD5K626_9FUNG|nr:hypothetical protein BDA99DRAFT_534902 [Phascolomyces articulosus]
MQNGDEVFFTALLFISNIHCWLPINYITISINGRRYVTDRQPNLNSLPTKRPTSDSKKRYWKYIWPRLTRLMKEIDRLCHDDDLRENDSDQPLSIKNDFIMWIDQPNTDSAHRSPSTSQYTLTQHSSD